MKEMAMRIGATGLLWTALAGVAAEPEPPVPVGIERGMVAAFDTRAALPEGEGIPASSEGPDWERLEDPAPARAPKGDAVAANHAIAVLARKDADGVDLYARSRAGWTRRARLIPVGADGAPVAATVKTVAADGEDATIVLAVGSGTMTLTVGAGFPGVKTVSAQGASALRIHAPCRFGVLPDFFASDLMVDARAIPIEETEIPSDNFFLQMLADGDSLLASVWEKNVRDVRIRLSGSGETRRMESLDVFYGEGGSVWVAAIEEPGVWHYRNLTDEDMKGNTTLDWPVPFPAKWKANFTRALDGIVESRAFRMGKSRGGDPWITTARDGVMQAHLIAKQPTRGGIARLTQAMHSDFSGPFLAYPLSREPDTPIDKLAIDDLMRHALGQGPCEYILDVSGRQAKNRGIFTCAYRDTLNPIFAVGHMREERAFIERMNRNVLIFVTHIQDRINSYVDFRAEMMAFLAERKKAQPEHADFIGRVEKQLDIIGDRRAEGAKQSQQVFDTIRRAILADTPDNVAVATGVAGRIAQLGQGQDDRVAACRQVVKILRGMASMEMATNPDASELAKDIRARTETIMRNPVGYEQADAW